MNASKDNIEKIRNEISLKDLLLKSQDWTRKLLGKWYIIVICGLFGAGAGLGYSIWKKQLYVAQLSFVLEDSKSGSLGSYSGIASQFGIDLGGGGSGGVFSGDNIIEFLKSRLMVEKALLSEVPGNPKQSLADFYIQFMEMNKGWEKNTALKNVRFPPGANRNKFTLTQDSILQKVYEVLVNKNLIIEKTDKKLNFVLVTCATENEMFSKHFVERLVNEAVNFYINTKTQRTKVTVDRLQAKSDSVEYLLNKKTYSIAASQDMNLNPARKLAGVQTEVTERDRMMLLTMYGEIVKNLELSKMSMAQETPIIQIVDTPILPLKKDRVGKLKGILIGGVLAGVFSAFAILLSFVYKEIIS